MSDKVPMPASGDAHGRGAPDGVSGAPDESDGRGVHGRTEDGESSGGNYPNPQTGKAGPSGDGGASGPGSGNGSGFGDGASGHGGQTQIDYHGSGQRGADGAAAGNAVAGSTSAATEGAEVPAPAADRPPHDVTAQGRTFSVVETSGIAAAEAAGDLGPDAANDNKDSDKAG